MAELLRWLSPKVGTLSASKTKLSLLDVGPGERIIEWWALFYPRQPHFWWARWLKQGFRHCELMRPHYYGPELKDVLWLVLRPHLELLENHIEFDPTPPWIKYPGVTIVKVQLIMKPWKVRQWFFVGPFSCVEICKAALGINKFWMRTPRQLYKYLIRHNGVLGVD